MRVIRPAAALWADAGLFVAAVNAVESARAVAQGDHDTALNGARQHEAAVVVGMLAEQVDSSRRTGHHLWRLAKAGAVCVGGALLDVSQDLTPSPSPARRGEIVIVTADCYRIRMAGRCQRWPSSVTSQVGHSGIVVNTSGPS